MRFRDVSIVGLLGAGLGMMLALVAGLGILAWVQMGRVRYQTRILYEHPLVVRKAVDMLTLDVLSMYLGLHDYAMAQREGERQEALQAIDEGEADAFEQLDVLRDHYFGPPGDVERTRSAMAAWRSMRDETIRRLNAAHAPSPVLPDASVDTDEIQVEELQRLLRVIGDFAAAEAEELYNGATTQPAALAGRIVATLAGAVFVALAAALLIARGIVVPLTEISAAAARFGQGALDARSSHVSSNEFGRLSDAFNTMARAIQAEVVLGEKARQVTDIALRSDEPVGFCRDLLAALLPTTRSQVGAVYLLNDRKTHYEHLVSVGMTGAGRAPFSAMDPEGELGMAIAARRIQHFADIPPNARFTFAAVSGDYALRGIITIPILSDNEVSGVISLASLLPYEVSSLRLVDSLWSVLSARVNSVLAFREARGLAERLERQNQELDAQNAILSTQAAELARKNEEIERQKLVIGEAYRQKSAFLSNMSHELRTPLSSVIALSGVLGRRLKGTLPAEEQGYIEIIERNGRNLLELINDILDLSRLEAGRNEVHVTLFAVSELVGEIAALLEPLAREKNIAVHDRVPPDLPPLASDRDKCRHILQNVIANAVKFTEKGEVIISGSSEPRTSRDPRPSVRITVADTGIGILPEELPHIFEDFRQGDESTTRKYGGSGLGLAIARRYALLLGGGISADSQPGKGSTFTITLPQVLEAQASGRSPSLSSATSAPAARGHAVLVVEDNELSIVQLSDILGSEGYRVRVARNGREALAQLAQDLPSAVILDLIMPEVDGFEILRSIRAVKRTARLPVVVLTAKHVTSGELSVLEGNHVFQLIRKGDIDRSGLLDAVAKMVSRGDTGE